MEHAYVEEGEVVVGFAVASGGDPAFCFQPGVGAFDRPAVARLLVVRLQLSLLAAPDLAYGLSLWEWVAGAAAFADTGLDLALA